VWFLSILWNAAFHIFSMGGYMTMIKAGSTIYHRPSDAEWFVMGVNEKIGRLCVTGNEPLIFLINDCELVDIGKGLTAGERRSRAAIFGPEWG
jgi:hypothetical protein